MAENEPTSETFWEVETNFYRSKSRAGLASSPAIIFRKALECMAKEIDVNLQLPLEPKHIVELCLRHEQVDKEIQFGGRTASFFNAIGKRLLELDALNKMPIPLTDIERQSVQNFVNLTPEFDPEYNPNTSD